MSFTFQEYREHVLAGLRIEWSEDWLAARIDRVEAKILDCYDRGIKIRNCYKPMLRGHL